MHRNYDTIIQRRERVYSKDTNPTISTRSLFCYLHEFPLSKFIQYPDWGSNDRSRFTDKSINYNVMTRQHPRGAQEIKGVIVKRKGALTSNKSLPLCTSIQS